MKYFPKDPESLLKDSHKNSSLPMSGMANQRESVPSLSVEGCPRAGQGLAKP